MSYAAVAQDETEDRYHTQVEAGDVRLFTLDQLDAAFNAGLIHENTYVCLEGSSEWLTLGEVAGLGDEEEPVSAPVPVAAPVSYARPVAPTPNAYGLAASPSVAPAAPYSVAPMVMPRSIAPVSNDLSFDDDMDMMSMRPKRRLGKVIAGLAVVGLAGLGFAVVQSGGIKLPKLDPSVSQASAASLTMSGMKDSSASSPAKPTPVAEAPKPEAPKAEAALTHRGDVAHLFGTSRSYFHADLATVGDAVVFLRSLLPGKPIDEIYTVLGRAKQGKTERYRTFFHHFAAHPDERLVHAEGTPGMVMAVFTLPSYPLVFKVIRDRFAYPKAMSRQDVEDKYDLVFHLDRVGRLLRRFSLDELPQLWNVLRGQMSLVGPRPLPLRDYRLLDDWHRKRYLVLPGMTGLWQISGRSGLSFDDLVRLDFTYIENWSIWLDITILARTIPAVLARRGAY